MTSGNDEFSTTIGPDAVVTGQLRFEKGLRLLGQVEGEIVSEDGNLLIGEGAKLTGDAKVGTIRLDGEVKGNLTATNKVHLSSAARLEGDLQTARLEVAEGAVLLARCVIGVNVTDSQGTAPKATAPVSAPKEMVKPKRDDARPRLPVPEKV